MLRLGLGKLLLERTFLFFSSRGPVTVQPPTSSLTTFLLFCFCTVVLMAGDLQLVATGSSMAPTPPIIVKRAILTGHPYRVHKKVVTMRYMFFNREDVLFYKPVQLVSKQGRRGWIKEALGTHGMSCARMRADDRLF